MKSIITIKKFWLVAITLFAFLLNGCDISSSNKSSSTEELSDEELEVAGQIIAESLSDQQDGIFASLNNAFSLPSSNNLSDNSAQKGKYASELFDAVMAKNEAAAENNYSYNYDPDSGVHTVTFNQNVNNSNISKESSATLEYIYYTPEGDFIYSPRLESDRIETIEYNGQRTGSIISDKKISTYERTDQFMVDGLTSSSSLISITGSHQGSGEYKVTRDNGDSIERSYTLTVEFLDVKINNQIVSDDGSLQKGVEGSLAYEMLISKNVNGNESIKTVNGTIEFNGDGTALLRFQDVLDDFKVKLEDGNLLEDDEFEGYIRTVNTDGDGSFTLFNDELYLFNADTDIDPEGDLTTLQEIQSVLGANIRVEAEGAFVDNTDGAHIVRTVKFEYEEEDLEFEDVVGAIDIESNTITLADESVLNINEGTVFDSDGDLTSLEEVIWALDNDFKVEAEGHFILGEGNARVITDLKFEYEDEEFKFEDDVQSVNAEESSLTLANGEVYVIDETTSFHEKTDLNSIEAVAAVLSEGGDVAAEGEHAPQPDGTMLVKKVKFETDDIEDDGSGDPENPDTSDFEGEVNSANASGKTISVAGVTYHIMQSTEFDDRIRSLGNLVGALERGDRVLADGEYYFDGDKNIAVEIEFEVDRKGNNSGDEGERDEFKFEAGVSSVDLATQTFVLTGGLTLSINSDTKFDDGNIESLEELANALNNGDDVDAEGKYYSENESNIVIKVEFETDGDDRGDDNDDDGDDGEDREFEGKIRSVNVAGNSFELVNSRVYVLNNESTIENDGDFFSLQEVKNALEAGQNVTAEGNYSSENSETSVVTSVKFEVEEDDDDGDNGDENGEDEFEGKIKSVNIGASTFKLMNDKTYTLDNNSVIDDEGNLFSLQDVEGALQDGDNVTAEGIYTSTAGNLLVVSVMFKSNKKDDNGDDGDDDDDGGDDEELEFEGTVDSATSTSFIIGSDTFFVTNDTEFKGKDVTSMQDVINALNDGDEVEAEGDYYIDGGENIVKKVKFKVEENDDNNGDDGDDGDDEEFEFEGTVNTANSSSFIVGSDTYVITADTEFKGDDATSMQDVIDALEGGDEVKAEGDYYIDGADNIVTKVKFEVEENNDDNGDDGDDGDDGGNNEKFEFEGTVNSANSSSFTIDGETYIVTNDTKFTGNDVRSMQELLGALNDGDDVEAEGTYTVDNSENIVVRVRFKVEENNDNNGGDEGGDDEELDFEGSVSSATSSSFIISDQTYTVNESTEFDGDIESMQELIDALENGDDVEADGKYYEAEGSRIVIEVDFDVETDD